MTVAVLLAATVKMKTGAGPRKTLSKTCRPFNYLNKKEAMK